jgi:hypothetical protein
MRSCGEGCNWIACCQVRTDEWWYFPQTLLVATVLNIFVLSLCIHTHLLVLLHLIILYMNVVLKIISNSVLCCHDVRPFIHTLRCTSLFHHHVGFFKKIF